MAKDFVHVVITRFNAAVGYSASLKRLDNTWLRERIVLFEQYCLPSIRAQQAVEFKWVIFMDAQSPQWLREKIDGYGPPLSAIYVDGPFSDSVIATRVAASGYVSAPYLITTRLDSDDALANHHLARVQLTFCQQQREFIEYPVGLQSFRGHLYNVYYPSNPFLSLIERVQDNGGVTTVHCVEHDRVRTAGKVRRIVVSPQWKKVIHSANVGNTLRGVPRIHSHMHPGFNAIWPEVSEPDSLFDRFRYSVNAYGKRARMVGRRKIEVASWRYRNQSSCGGSLRHR